MAKLALENFLPYRLNRIGATVSGQFRKIYGPQHDLTIPEWRVLATLGQFEELGAKEIGQHSSMHKTKVSRAVRGLEERRWLKRRDSHVDGREEILSLTPAGRRVYEVIVPKALAFESRLLADMGMQAEALQDTLDRLEKILGIRSER